MKILCPKCASVVPAEHINVATDLLFCPRCAEAFRISPLMTEQPARAELPAPVPGTWFREGPQGTVVGATTRSPAAFFVVPFMCVWSGGSLGGIYGSQIASGHFNLLTSLFGIPFVLGSLFFGSMALMTVAGKVVVTIRTRGEERSSVFTGIGPFGWTRRFDWAQVASVREHAGTPGRSGRQSAVVLEGARRLAFAGAVSDPRRYFLLRTLQYLKAQDHAGAPLVEGR